MKKWKSKNYDDAAYEHLEKVQKLRKRHKKTPAAAELDEEFEKDEEAWAVGGEDGAFAARVVEVHKRYAFVSGEKQSGKINTGDVWLATMARKFLVAARNERNFVAVGDRVLCVPAPNQAVSTSGDAEDEADLPRCVMQNLSPRRSKIARLDPHKADLAHVLATNMDQLVVVASFLCPTVKWGLIDRYLVLAEAEGIPSIIILNKSDLLAAPEEAEFAADAQMRIKTYRDLGYKVFIFKANEEDAGDRAQLKELKQILKGRISLFSGHSGVGKSSVINLFDPEIIQPVEPDSDIFYKGRHTTTYASFIKLGTGGYVIDTPGVRSFTFPEKTAIELSHCFVELRPYIGQCKFRECRHLDEPGCKVTQAVETGEISRWRYKSYLGILLGATGREGRIRDLSMEDED